MPLTLCGFAFWPSQEAPLLNELLRSVRASLGDLMLAVRGQVGAHL